MNKAVAGFSKFTKEEKINWIAQEYFSNPKEAITSIQQYWNSNEKLQQLHDEFIENTITNFYLPLGIAPNFLINGTNFTIPMAIEESSVVAACARAANFWLTRGGFHAEVISTTKLGQVHFIWNGESDKLFKIFHENKNILLASTKSLSDNMEKRGGGIRSLNLVDRTKDEPGYFQIVAEFETCDAMGANFINSILEVLGRSFKEIITTTDSFSDDEKELQIIMAILSNYTPDCRVKTYVECNIEDLNDPSLGMSAEEFVEKFSRAIRISKIDVTRATTHNKGIFNGIDAGVIKLYQKEHSSLKDYSDIESILNNQTNQCVVVDSNQDDSVYKKFNKRIVKIDSENWISEDENGSKVDLFCRKYLEMIELLKQCVEKS